MSSLSNPFNIVYEALWSSILEHPYTNEIFKLGNRVDLTDARNGVKKKLASADLPELMLIPTDLVGKLHATSSSTSCIKRYQWVVTTGDFRVDSYLFPISWAIFTSLVRSQRQLLSLEYESAPFVRRLDLTSSNDGQSQAQRDSNIDGWSTVQTIEVEMFFTTSALVAGATPVP